jgi:PST family polysaccharide transporter
MWSGILVSVVALITRSWIVRELGIEANGIYQAAWGISGMFGGFILGAMGTDFFPRLTAVVSDNKQVNRLVNEQTEIGILLSLPGLIGTLAFAPWIMHIFYSAKFLGGAQLLPWFILGIFGRVISWPMTFILTAKGESRWFATVETFFNIFHLALTLVLLHWLGLWGVALSFAILYAFYCLAIAILSHHLTGFRWSQQALRLLLLSTVLIIAGYATQKWLPGTHGIVIGGALTVIAGLFSLRGIATRLGSDHRLIQLLCRFPGGKLACGI